MEEYYKMLNVKTEKILCIVLACSAIVLALIGILGSSKTAISIVENVYGQQVELYGNGVYAYNSVLTVSSRLGADWMGIVGGLFLIILCLNKKGQLWIDVLKTAQCTTFVYYFSCLTFSISMNRLYLFYVVSFGISVFLAIHFLSKYFKNVEVKEEVKTKNNIGIRLCLIVSGMITIIVWLSMIVPCLISQNFGELLGVLTTEVTYAIDLGILCPLMIICGIWIGKRNDNGYKLAPILLYVLFTVGPMVILQNLYCIKFGIEVPLPAFVGTVMTFIVMGLFAIIYLKKSILFLEKHRGESI